MSAIKEYKCPACGGTMEFDSTSQKMKCPYCDTEISVEEYEALNESQTNEDKKSGQTEKSTKESTFVTYICESCGGEITADKTTGATTCPFCGNRVVLKGQFEGGLKPTMSFRLSWIRKRQRRLTRSIWKEKLLYRLFLKRKIILMRL